MIVHKFTNLCGSSMRTILFKTGLRAVGLVLFIFVVSSLEWTKLAAILNKANPAVLIMTPFITAAVFALKCVRWHFVLQSENINLGKGRTVRIYCNGLLAGLITPGRLGELIKITDLHESGASLASSFAATLKDRIIDIVFFIILAIISVYVFFDLALKQRIITVTISLTFLCFSVWITKNFRFFLNSIIVVMPEKVRNKCMQKIAWPYHPESMSKNRKTEIAYLITIIFWLIHFVLMRYIAQSMNIELTFIQVACCISLVVLVALFPITIGGLGTRDLTLIFLFKRIGLEPEQAVVFSMSFLYVHFMILFIASFFWLFLRCFPSSMNWMEGWDK